MPEYGKEPADQERTKRSLLITISSKNLGHEGGGRRRLVPPVRRELARGAVVPGEAVDARLDENKAELGVLVLTVALKVLAHGHRLLDKEVQVLRDLRGKAVLLQKAEDLLAGDRGDLR